MKRKECDTKSTIQLLKQHFESDLALTLSLRKTNSGYITCSNSIAAKDIAFWGNGKGIDKAFSIASAYAELHERVYNNCFLRFSNALLSIDYRRSEGEEYELFIERVEKMLEYEGVNDCALRSEMIRLSGIYYRNVKYPSDYISFYNHSGKQLKAPTFLCDFLLGTNGMAAGNTYEEAYVQAFSEILERNAVNELFRGNILPDKVRISEIRDAKVISCIKRLQKTFRGAIEFYTFERCYNYPVVAVLLWDYEHARYRLKFGAHYNLDFAVERCITELFQGSELTDKSAWHPVCKSFAYEPGDVDKFVKDGTGHLSKIALLNLITTSQEFTTGWGNVSDHQDAYRKICLLNYDTYVYRAPSGVIPTVQLYVPQISRYQQLTLEAARNQIEAIERSIKFRTVQLASGQGLNKSHVEMWKSLYESSANKEDSLEQFSVFGCPVEKQLLRKISVKQFDVLVNIHFNQLTPVVEYLSSKCCTSSERDRVMELVLLYIKQGGCDLPEMIERCYPDDLKKKAKRYASAHGNQYYSIHYCPRCPRFQKENCIEHRRQSLFLKINPAHDQL